jgi:hypothetical protein
MTTYLQDWAEWKRARRGVALLDRAAHHLKARGERRIGPTQDFVILTDAGDVHAFITLTSLASELEGRVARRPMVRLSTASEPIARSGGVA